MRPSYLQKIREKIPFPGCYFLLCNLSLELLPVQVSIDMLPSATLDFVQVGAVGPELGSFPSPQIRHILPGLRRADGHSPSLRVSRIDEWAQRREARCEP